MSASDQNLLVQEEQQTSGQIGNTNSQDGIPQFMIDQASFPYDFGPTFVASLVASGGNAAVDNAFRHPPTLDAQIVDPSTFTPGVQPPVVSLPAVPAGATLIVPSSGFGEVTLVEMLGDQIGFTQAFAGTRSWEQDQYQSYRQNGRVCVDVSVLTTGRAAAGALTQLGQQWAHHLPGASVSQSSDTVNFHSCDPGPSWKPATNIADPYQALAVRSQVTYQLLTDGDLQPTVASCAADQLMKTIGPQKLEEAEASTDSNAAAVKELQDEVKVSVTGCLALDGSRAP
jgi:hypothetical protein